MPIFSVCHFNTNTFFQYHMRCEVMHKNHYILFMFFMSLLIVCLKRYFLVMSKCISLDSPFYQHYREWKRKDEIVSSSQKQQQQIYVYNLTSSWCHYNCIAAADVFFDWNIEWKLYNREKVLFRGYERASE